MIRIDTFGPLHVTRDGAEAEGLLKQRLRAALLVYLAIERESTRDAILAMLWPDRDDEHGRHALSQTLYELRKVLGEDWLRAEGDRLVVTNVVETDVEAFERAVDAGRMAEALDLYRAPFLSGNYLADSKAFESWVDQRRARLVRQYRRALRERIDALVKDGDTTEALRVASRAVERDPLDDEAQHRLIELLAATGRRADAIAHYETYTRALTNEELEPLQETRELFERIRAGEGVVQHTRAPVRMETPVAVEVGESRRRFSRRAIAVAAAVLSLGAGAYMASRLVREKPATVIAATSSSDGIHKTIAVLPFQSLGAADSNAWFADGMHEEILTHLSSIRTLRVISRQSLMEYRNTTKSTRQIAQELGADVLLGGSVLRARDSVRVTLQLVDANSDRNLWAASYNRSVADVFAIQAEIARNIADTLRVQLDVPQSATLEEAPPTKNIEAWDFYLRGRQYVNRGVNPENFRLGLEMFERAVELDSTFADAWADMAGTHLSMYWYRYDASDARRVSAQRALERALALAPERRKVQRARYYYLYNGLRDFEAALAVLDSLEVFYPAMAWERGLILRRRGRFEEAATLMENAVQSNPRSPGELYNLGLNYTYVRQYDRALQWHERAYLLAPDEPIPPSYAGMVQLLKGDAAAARAWHDRITRPDAGSWVLGFSIYLSERKFEEALKYLEGAPDVIMNPRWYVPRSLYQAKAHQLAGRASIARQKYEQARVVLDSARRALPEDARVYGSLSLAYAGLGRKAEAVRASQRAVALLPIEEDAMWGSFPHVVQAEMYVMIGDHEAAIDRLEYLLSIPSLTSAAWLRINPTWDPLRNHPRFMALAATRS